MSGKIVKIVWNGVDGYIEAEEAAIYGYDFDGEKLYTTREAFTAFDAVEIDPVTLPLDEYGEPDFDGILGSVTGKFYKLPSEQVSR